MVPALSTAAAAAALADGTAQHDAALAAPIAAERYRLAVLAEDVEDNPDAVTRFVLVSRPGQPPLPSGNDKTSLVAFIADDHPGALLEVLTEFAVRGVNLTRIESRPTGERLGRYCFSIDAEGHVDEARVGEALMGLRRVCPDVRFLGSYPRADARPDADSDRRHRRRDLPRRCGLARVASGTAARRPARRRSVGQTATFRSRHAGRFAAEGRSSDGYGRDGAHRATRTARAPASISMSIVSPSSMRSPSS